VDGSRDARICNNIKKGLMGMNTKVYLAGGHRGNWRDNIKAAFLLNDSYDAEFFDPAQHGLEELDQYGVWDLYHVKRSDIVFGYMERTNPGGFGLACELGYAYGLGKTVILCLENDHTLYKDRYLDFMKKVANITFNDFGEAVAYLQKIVGSHV
jgi:nucleoside 2-deoxyribosyltransferase